MWPERMIFCDLQMITHGRILRQQLDYFSWICDELFNEYERLEQSDIAIAELY